MIRLEVVVISKGHTEFDCDPKHILNIFNLGPQEFTIRATLSEY